ncbi:MAG: pyruvate ferredoxin oxidoreductase [Chloroflexia bacterium]|nr:pyruvate ferredoxin oxidoreductase [Chloroflexia bacterium]
MEKVISGNYAVSYGAKLARAQVISAYPITPQTSIIEKIASFCADGELDAVFVKVESEHSAMAACVGASATGARAFTASSGQGLLLMHEMLHWAAGARLPIVMGAVNRGIAPGWSVWTEQSDTLSQRETGWMQFYCESNQEVVDTVVQAFKIAETVSLPAMVILDAFVLSHTSEVVDIPDQALVDQYLPPYQPQLKLDVDDPHAFGGLVTPNDFFELRYKIQKAMEDAVEVARRADEEWEELFGRRWHLVESYHMEGAEVGLVTTSTITSTAREVIDQMRAEGIPIGLVKMRMFRPFPARDVEEALRGVKKVAVLDRNLSFGFGGIFAEEIKAALYSTAVRPPIFNFILGLGGRDVTPALIREIADYTLEHDEPAQDLIWMGVRA